MAQPSPNTQRRADSLPETPSRAMVMEHHPGLTLAEALSHL
jgi:hypothetical protein